MSDPRTKAEYSKAKDLRQGLPQREVMAIEYLSYKKIGGNLLEEIFEQLSGEIDSDIVERSFEWTEKDEEELGKIVLDYIDRHIGFNCFGIKNERVIQGIA